MNITVFEKIEATANAPQNYDILIRGWVDVRLLRDPTATARSDYVDDDLARPLSTEDATASAKQLVLAQPTDLVDLDLGSGL